MNMGTMKHACAQTPPGATITCENAAGLNIVVPEHLRDLEGHLKFSCAQFRTALPHGDVQPVQRHLIRVEVVEPENTFLVAVCSEGERTPRAETQPTKRGKLKSRPQPEPGAVNVPLVGQVVNIVGPQREIRVPVN